LAIGTGGGNERLGGQTVTAPPLLQLNDVSSHIAYSLKFGVVDIRGGRICRVVCETVESDEVRRPRRHVTQSVLSLSLLAPNSLPSYSSSVLTQSKWMIDICEIGGLLSPDPAIEEPSCCEVAPFFLLFRGIAIRS
jgi:hypothetical protein